MWIVRIVGMIIGLALLNACAVGPNYKRPPAKVPVQFKEAPKGWKILNPCDDKDRGEWWKIFNDPQLDILEAKVNISNQNIALAAAQFWQARALVDQARAAFFPTLTGVFSMFRQKSSGAGSTASGGSSGFIPTGPIGGGGPSTGPFTSGSILLNGTWEPDLWGKIRRNVEASVAGAQASAAQLALARLSAQASLAQYYFELRGVDADQQLLNRTVVEYKKALQLTQNRYTAGVVGRTDVIQAQSQLETAEAQAINIGISRAQYEHAIAVLIGEPPSCFSLPFYPLIHSAPLIPLEVPSALLERRPDIAQAERLMKQANVQIGVAIAAYFPAITLSGLINKQGIGSIANWLSNPTGWSAGGQIAQTILDGGLRSATVSAARANYVATVASYRQVILTAFQDVEDNLVSLRLLKAQTDVLNKAAQDARFALKLITNQYKAGTVAYSDVITAQTTAYTAEKNALDVNYLQMTSAVGLVKALGGGWSICKDCK